MKLNDKEVIFINNMYVQCNMQIQYLNNVYFYIIHIVYVWIFFCVCTLPQQ